MADYYKTLELPRKCSRGDITASFKRLAKKFHPLNTKIDMATNAQQFSKVCEAYEVLSNNEYKEIYDAYGEKVLKYGFDSDQNINFEGVYQFKGNSDSIFNSYFDSGKEFAASPFNNDSDFKNHFEKFEQERQRIKVIYLK